MEGLWDYLINKNSVRKSSNVNFCFGMVEVDKGE